MTEADIDAKIAEMKAKGEWTECHEKGHDMDSPQHLVCLRCGEDFEYLALALEGHGK